MVEIKFKKEHLWLQDIFLYQKINTQCVAVFQYVQNIQALVHLDSVQNTKAGAMANSSVGQRLRLLFFSFFLLITEKPRRRSRVAVVVDPSRHPRLRLGNVRLDFPVFVLWRFLFDPHGVVARDAVLLTRALEESALRGETYRKLVWDFRDFALAGRKDEAA